MSHEPGRERYMIHKCEKCGVICEDRELNESIDEYWCGSCIDNENEAAYERNRFGLGKNIRRLIRDD